MSPVRFPRIVRRKRRELGAWVKSWLKRIARRTETIVDRLTDHSAAELAKRNAKRQQCKQQWRRSRKQSPHRRRTITLTAYVALLTAHVTVAVPPQTNKAPTEPETTIAMMATANEVDPLNTQQPTTFDTDSEPIGIDNRCTACMSHRIEDFESVPTPVDVVVRGYAGKETGGVMKGVIRWQWTDNAGMTHTHRIPGSYYVPDGGHRLLSPQHWAQQFPAEQRQSLTTATGIRLQWGRKGQYQLDVPFDKQTNVANIPTAPGFTRAHAFMVQAEMDPETEDAGVVINDFVPSVDPPVKDTGTMPTPLVELGEIFAYDASIQQHVPKLITWEDIDDMAKGAKELKQPPEVTQEYVDAEPTIGTAQEFLRWHQRLGHLSMSAMRAMAAAGILPSRLANCEAPVCPACMFGKAQRRPWRHKPTVENKQSVVDPTVPGQVVSVDQMVSQTPGLVAQMSGFITSKRYTVATVFVDQATKYGFTFFQSSTSADETLLAKQAFEDHCRRMNVQIQHYHADNGVFASQAWRDSCVAQQQGLTFAGVNAHHQNGIAERRIKELTHMARTQLIHASRRWRTAITANLWPYPFREAQSALNEAPHSGLKATPLELFSRSTIAPNVRHRQPFGCPVYVLSEQLQSQPAIMDKWTERARVGVYLGRSPQHARSVALVLNLQTGHVSPQFHVRYDPTFSTIKRSFGEQLPESRWQVRCGFERGPAPKMSRPTTTRVTFAPTAPSGPREPEGGVPEPPMPADNAPPATESPSQPNASETTDDQFAQPSEDLPPLRRSTRMRRPVDRLVFLAELAASHHVGGEILSFQATCPSDTHAAPDPILAMAASTNPDIMYLHEAMREPDRKQFLRAMVKEVQAQMVNNNFTVIRREQVPEGVQVLPAVWAMRRKRHIKTRKVYKWKARLNIDGSRMVRGVHYDESYAPVATWGSIRFLLALVLKHGWLTRQIDFVAAYTQAPVERELYMAVPRGFDIEGGGDPKDFVLRIERNIYGQKQAGRVWNHYLARKLIDIGFHQCDADPCVFVRKQCVYVLYTDDSILAGPTAAELDEVIADMKASELDITVEGDITDFLGVNIVRRDDNTFELTQPHLIDDILTELRLTADRTQAKSTPAAISKILTRCPQSPAHDDHFHYRRVIGKLNYLDRGSRPDISHATHQCARFSADPKQEHANAVKWLGRYLLGTRDQGLIMRITDDDFTVHVDADFAGSWKRDEAESDADTARSRHGYVVSWSGCPLIWASRLQTEIALSSTESEFIGLSTALRETIPLMELLRELKQQGIPVGTTKPKVFCRVFEDNSGALEIASVPKMRPRTKTINIKYHHFRQYVDRGEIEIHAIKTEDNPADILTKSVSLAKLQRHRKTILGWEAQLNHEVRGSVEKSHQPGSDPSQESHDSREHQRGQASVPQDNAG